MDKLEARLVGQSGQLEARLMGRSEQLEARLKEQSEQFQEAVKQLSEYQVTAAEAVPLVWLVRLWPYHFSSRPDYNITCTMSSRIIYGPHA